jgi:DNA repair exonuclease SbcCD ATPase subunit
MGEDALHNLKVTQLKKEIETLKKVYKENKEQYETIKGRMDTVNEELQKYRDYNERLEEKIAQITQRMGSDVDKEALARVQRLVGLNEALKKQENDFRNMCKTEMLELKDQLSKLESSQSVDTSSDILAAYEADLKRMKQIKKLLALKNREIAIAQRKLDDIPSRPELVQYERRFTELYAQIALQLDETRKYYDTYNTLSETKKYLDKENSLLNSVSEYFQKSLTSKAKDYKTWMLSNVEKTVEAVRKSKDHVEKRLNEERTKRDERNQKYQDLVTIKRNYYRAVKELENEYKKNEELRKRAKQILEQRKAQ